ncbi:RNA polymerase sigma subunit ECF family protein [Primorskyibacter flagellatus]|uniref:RNA polymerase sigma subunit ECF family protein n=1 Tax=Primorskyibacter flagellatus TaxID=1387277 RepID=A0A917EFR9_9RHOB|nr:RNA polymerase sigma subunit ECF family protein [Primorskyibacter flagellatus]
MTDMPFDDLTLLDDDALLLLYSAGDPAAARILTERLAPRVHAHAWRLLGDAAEAEDVTQEALLRLWKIAPDWRQGEAKVTTWLYRVTANLATDRLRRGRGRGVALDAIPEPEDGQPSAEARMQEADRAAALQEALATLPDRQRQAVVLRHLDGLANPDIAAIMDLGVEAVESLVARGKRGLAAALSGMKESLGYNDD